MHHMLSLQRQVRQEGAHARNASKTLSAMSMQHVGSRCHAAGPVGKRARIIIGRYCRSCGNVAPRHWVANTCSACCFDDDCPAHREHLHSRVPTPPPPPPPPVSQRPQRARAPRPPPPQPAPGPSRGVRHWEPLPGQPHVVGFAPGSPTLPACCEQPPPWSSWRRLACINPPTRFACCICRFCGAHA